MTDKQRVVSTSRRINASPEAIFNVLASPAGHVAIDGSGTVVAPHSSSPERLELGSKFAMSMKMGMPYRISNEVVEFEENRLIAWQHFGHHIWRYRLEAVDNATLVTEEFDWSKARSPRFIELMRYPTKHIPGMEQTLQRLADHVEASVS